MLTTAWRFFLTETWRSLRRHKTAVLTTLLQCITSLTMLGICLAFIINANHITLSFLNTLEMEAYLRPEVTRAEAERLQVELTQLPGVASVRYISKDEAFQLAQEALSFQVQDLLGEGNPFPASLRIRATHAAALQPLQIWLTQAGAVEDVLGPGEYGSIVPVMFFIQAACFFLTLLLAGMTLFTIKNTIQLAILFRRPEIRVMQLVGATPTFVRIPFLLEGGIYGLVGAMVAWITVTGSYAAISQWMQSQNPLQPLAPLGTVAFNELVVLLMIGLLVGLLGALVSVDKHLTEKYLYAGLLPEESLA